MKKKTDQDSGGEETTPRVVSVRVLVPLVPGETNIARRIGHAVGVTTAVATIFSMGAVLTWVAVTTIWTIAGSSF